MYAIFRAAGFQYRAEPGELLRLPTLEAEPGQKVEFDEVLLGATEDDVVVGRPLVDGAKVVAEVVGHGRGDKIIVWKFRRRKGYRRKQGHRQDFTQVRVEAVDLGDGRRAESPAAKAAAKPARKRAARKTARKTAKKKTARTKAAKSSRGSKAKKSTKKKTKE
jgi:large subunit ribosomal protein L21